MTDTELTKVDGTPTPEGWRKINETLRKTMPTQQFKGKGGRTYTYINARQVQDRLDAAVGPGNWATEVRVIRSEHPVAVLVGLAIFGIWKWDAGYSNNPDADNPEDRAYEDEPLKAAVSDGFKRAAVQWGIGRWLYSSGAVVTAAAGHTVNTDTGEVVTKKKNAYVPTDVREADDATDMVRSADEKIWTNWLKVRDKGLGLGLNVPELRLPMARAELRGTGSEVLVAIKERERQLVDQDEAVAVG